MKESSMIGKNVPRLDALEKVTGKAKYSVDLNLPGMLHAKVLRSPYPHARIIHIDTTEAEKATGVKAVITGRDVSEEKIGFIRDRYILARDRVRFLGEAVAAVAADKVEAAEEALELIKVEYEELPGVFDAEEAMKPNPSVVIHPDLYTYPLAPNPTPLYRFEPDLPNVYIHRQVLQGDPERAFREADMVIEN
jgi:CO/xanthine dehydrogenase Mo-binding subunit